MLRHRQATAQRSNQLFSATHVVPEGVKENSVTMKGPSWPLRLFWRDRRRICSKASLTSTQRSLGPAFNRLGNTTAALRRSMP